MADANRARKVADHIQKTVAQLLEGKIKDPRLGFITITDVRVTGDLQNATIFYTVYGSETERADTARALQSAKGLIRSEIGKALKIRLTPQIEFVADALPQAAASIEEKLRQAQEADQRLAEQAKTATPAGEADPYRSSESEHGEIDGFMGFDEDEL